MQPVSAAFLAALRGPHTVVVRAEAWRGGVQVGGSLRVLGGSVDVTSGLHTPTRRSLNLQLLPVRNLWSALSPAGTTMLISRGVRFPDGHTETVPCGTFDIDEQSLDYGPDGTLSITAPDVWVRVQRARFEKPRTYQGIITDVAAGLAQEAVGLGYGPLDATSTTTTRPKVEERDREQAIAALSLAAGAWVYTDVHGRVCTRDIPSLYQAPSWTVDASQSGVLLSATRARSRQRTCNVVIVSAGEVNGTPPFAPVTVADTDITSPTYVDGPFGRVPYFVTNQLITSTAHATAVAKTVLKRASGLAAQVDLTSVVNPALEPGDVIEVLFPPTSGNAAVVERHLIDTVNIPLTVDGTQQISTRSSRPEGDVPADS